MSRNLSNRIAKLENAIMPPEVRWLQTLGNKYGLDGETVREETDEQVIERHLKEHPEDAGLKFNFMVLVFVHPKSTGSEGNNVW